MGEEVQSSDNNLHVSSAITSTDYKLSDVKEDFMKNGSVHLDIYNPSRYILENLSDLLESSGPGIWSI